MWGVVGVGLPAGVLVRLGRDQTDGRVVHTFRAGVRVSFDVPFRHDSSSDIERSTGR